jgi:hypothetical protein
MRIFVRRFAAVVTIFTIFELSRIVQGWYYFPGGPFNVTYEFTTLQCTDGLLVGKKLKQGSKQLSDLTAGYQCKRYASTVLCTATEHKALILPFMPTWYVRLSDFEGGYLVSSNSCIWNAL